MKMKKVAKKIGNLLFKAFQKMPQSTGFINMNFMD